MIPTLLVILFIILLVLPVLVYNKRKDSIRLRCDLNPYSEIQKGPGYVIINDILDDSCRRDLVDAFYETAKRNKKLNEDVEISLYSDSKFTNQLSKIIGEQLYPVNSLDAQRCWIRYYYGGMKAQYYENYHHDKKRYGNDVKQYRVVIPIYDASDAVFTIDSLGEFNFTENIGVVLEAGNCLHKVEFTTGERLLLIMDYTTKECDSIQGHYICRGIDGYFWWFVDILWRHLSSFYYKISNQS